MRIPLALALSSVLVLSACGESYEDTDPEQIQKDVATAMKELESVHVTGSINEGGDALDLDFAVAENGNCEGSMGVDGIGSFEVLVADGVGFFKADEEFWTSQAGPQGARLVGLIGDRWVRAEGGMEDLVSICDFDELVGQFDEDDDEGLEKVTGTSEVDGNEVVEVAFTSEDGNKGTAFVLADAPHRVVRFEVDGEGEMTFSDFDEPVRTTTPAASDVISLSELD